MENIDDLRKTCNDLINELRSRGLSIPSQIYNVDDINDPELLKEYILELKKALKMQPISPTVSPEPKKKKKKNIDKGLGGR